MEIHNSWETQEDNPQVSEDTEILNVNDTIDDHENSEKVFFEKLFVCRKTNAKDLIIHS